MISLKVPARICFFGDHQDYLGLPVIAGSIDRYISLRAKPIGTKEFQLELKDLGTSRVIPLDSRVDAVVSGDFLLSSLILVKQKGLSFDQGYHIEISGDIPLNAGLSSSSALTVAWIRFLVEVQQGKIRPSNAEVGHWAYQAEVEFFDAPGGLMDQYTIAQMGLLFIDTHSGRTEKLHGKLGTLVVAESGVPKETLDVLKNARVYQEKAIKEVQVEFPDFDLKTATLLHSERYLKRVSKRYRGHWHAVIHNYDLTKRAKAILSEDNPDLETLGHLMNDHQKILENQIGNTPKIMTEMMNEARMAGALGTKIIGSGGGGCMVAMVEEVNKEQVMEAFLKKNAKKVYEIQLTYPDIHEQ